MLILSNILDLFFLFFCLRQYDLSDSYMVICRWSSVKEAVATFLEHKLSVPVYGSHPDQFVNSVLCSSATGKN